MVLLTNCYVYARPAPPLPAERALPGLFQVADGCIDHDRAIEAGDGEARRAAVGPRPGHLADPAQRQGAAEVDQLAQVLGADLEQEPRRRFREEEHDVARRLVVAGHVAERGAGAPAAGDG